MRQKADEFVDVLIVGSGPAGSVLAQELRRNGQRVLLLERGSFVVPGSMETRLIDNLIDTRTSVDGSIRKVLWDGAKLYGLHPKLYGLNTYPPGHSPSPVTDKRSAETQLLIGALENRANPLGMIPDADVRRVLFEGAGDNVHAVGVDVQVRSTIPETGAITDPNKLGLLPGETFVVHAKTVILSAGALGSPAILLRSGLKNTQIGRGVILHPSTPIMGRFDHPIDALSGTEASVYVDDHLSDRGYALESMAAQPFMYAAIMSPGPALHSYGMIKAFSDLAGFGVMLIDTPQPVNRLFLDERGEPEIDYKLSASDKRRLAQGVADADQANLVEKNLQFIPNRTMVTSAHMQLTTGTQKTTQAHCLDLHRNICLIRLSPFTAHQNFFIPLHLRYLDLVRQL